MQFPTTSEFDRKYLWKGSTRQKSEKCVINYNPSTLAKKLEFCSTNQKVIGVNLNPPKWSFLETIYRPLGGAAASNFYMLYLF